MPTNQFVISKPKPSIIKLPEQGMKKHDFIDDFKEYYVHLLGRDENCRSPHYVGEALSLAVRDRLMERWKATHQAYINNACRRVLYLSMEFLMGRTLSNAMLNLGVTDTVNQAMYDWVLKLKSCSVASRMRDSVMAAWGVLQLAL